MARLRYNGLATGSAGSLTALTLGASLTNSATSITFNAALTYGNGTAVPTIASPDYLPLSILDTNGNVTEIVWLTAYTSGNTTGTIVRGKEGTSGVSHASGDPVVHAPTVQDIGWTKVIDDDLSATTNLQTALSGTWAINSGVLRQSLAVNATAYRVSHATTFEPMGIMGAEVEVSYVSGTGTRRIGLLFRSNNQTQYSQSLYLESSNGTTWDIRLEADAATLMWNGPNTSYAGSGYVKLKILASGQGFDIWTDTTYIGYVPWGSNTFNNENPLKYVGLYTYGASADFRNLKVFTKQDVPPGW